MQRAFNPEFLNRLDDVIVFHPLNKPLPPARVWMLDKLAEAGRL